MAAARDPYPWTREHFLRHPPLLPRLLQLCTGLHPPAVVTAERRGDDVLLRAQGGETPWYLLSIAGAPDRDKLSAWPLAWLDAAEEERAEGWHVVLTDRHEVMAWLEGPDFRPEHGVGILPLALDLTYQIEVLRRPGEPLLTALSLWAARDRPEDRAGPILRQLCLELCQGDDPLLAVPLLKGLRRFAAGWVEGALAAFRPPAGPPAWWSTALEFPSPGGLPGE